MKKIFALLTALLLLSMAYTGAFAQKDNNSDATVVGTNGTFNVNFGDSYYGFCLMRNRRDADEGDVFETVAASGNAFDKHGNDISNALKVLLVEYFDTFFHNGANYTMDSPNNLRFKMTAPKASDFQIAVYRLEDEKHSSQKTEILALADNARELAKQRIIPDTGYEKLLGNGRKAVFDFKVFKSKQGEQDGKMQQDFFGFMVYSEEDKNPGGENPGGEAPDDVIRSMPQTGDESSMALWCAVFAACMAALAVAPRRRTT